MSDNKKKGEFITIIDACECELIKQKFWPMGMRNTVGHAREEYPKVSQKWVPVKNGKIQWKQLCMQMEQKIIEFENFGKKWFGENE